jgi:predicted metal-dependent hydrolase
MIHRKLLFKVDQHEMLRIQPRLRGINAKLPNAANCSIVSETYLDGATWIANNLRQDAPLYSFGQTL